MSILSLPMNYDKTYVFKVAETRLHVIMRATLNNPATTNFFKFTPKHQYLS